jgi:hypothetical protein
MPSGHGKCRGGQKCEKWLAAQVIMAVPHSACILVDYERGLSIPNLPWPRLRRALQQQNDHPWDVLLVGAPTILHHGPAVLY